MLRLRKSPSVTTLFLLLILLTVFSVSTAAQDVIEITYWATSNDPTAEQLMEEYNASQDKVRIVYEGVPYQQHYDRVVTGFAAGALPDLIAVPNVNAGMSWAAAGMLMNLDPFIEASDVVNEEDYYPAAWAPGVFDGSVFGIPRSIDTRGLLYNIDLFNEAGVEVPTNWEEFLAAAEAVTKDGVYAFTPECGGSAGCMVYDFGMFLVGNGGYIISPDSQACWANQPEAVEALEFWVELDQYTLPGWWEMSNEMDTLFANGQVAMMVAGPWKLNMEAINPDMVLGENYDVVGFPGSGNEGAPDYSGTMGGWMWSIAHDSPHAEEVWDFIEWLQTPERIAIFTSALPITFESAEQDRWSAYYYTDVYNTLALPNSRPPSGLSPAVLEIQDLETEAIQSAVLLDDMSAQQAMDNLCAQIEPLLG